MTTAQARAVPFVFANLRLSLMATASAGLLAALAPAANAASCVSSNTANDVCIINLANITDTHDGQGQAVPAGSGDTLQFNDNANPLTVTGKQFIAGTTPTAALNFANFEFAEIINNTTLTITSATNDAAPAGITAWTIAAGSTLNVSGTGGNAIGNTASMAVNGTFNVIESETIGALSGSGSIIVAGTEVLSADGAASTFSGVISGAGGFTKSGLGTLTLSGINTFSGPLSASGGLLVLTGANAISGAVNVNGGGELEIGNANAISTATAVNISNGGILSGSTAYTINAPLTISSTGARTYLAGNATINGNVKSNGGLQPGNKSVPTWPVPTPPATNPPNPGQDMGQITINGDYEATGAFAYVGMFIDIDASAPAGGVAGTDKDFLTIDGNIIGTQATKFAVVSFDEVPTGAATTGNGIQVIRITGTSANAGNEFYQGNALVAGPHQYLLRYVANYAGTDDGYFLQSAARDELVAHAGLLSAGQSLIRGCFRDDQRIPDSPKGATYGRAWFGYRQGNSSFGADTGVEQDQDYSCTTGGMDWRMGNGWFGGVSGGFGSSDSDIVVPSGTGKIEGDGRVIEAYAAFTSSAFFLNLSAGYADMDWHYTSRLGFADATSSGFIGSAQAGIGLGLEPIAVKLIGMLSYDGTNCGDDCFGIAGTSEDTGLIEAKGAMRFDGVTWGGSIRPWAQVAYSTILSDGVNTVTAGPYAIVSDTNDELLSIDAGLQSYLDENLALYLDGGYNESLSKDISGYRASIGAKLYW